MNNVFSVASSLSNCGDVWSSILCRSNLDNIVVCVCEFNCCERKKKMLMCIVLVFVFSMENFLAGVHYSALLVTLSDFWFEEKKR